MILNGMNTLNKSKIKNLSKILSIIYGLAFQQLALSVCLSAIITKGSV